MGMNMKSCIEVNHVSKCYGKVKAVSEISFTVLQGQISAFLGPNGAGKSTTMNILSSLLIPTCGEIIIEGYSMEKQQDQIKRLIGVVFQEDVLDSELTVYDNLYYRGSLYYRDKKSTINRINDVVSLLSIEKLIDKRYGACSGGQRRICQIARALMSSPKLLLLDEPTIGLDPIARKQVWDALLKLNQRLSMTIFFSTHYMEETVNADHICMINQGHILVCGKKDWVLREYKRQGTLTIQDIYIDLLSEDLTV